MANQWGRDSQVTARSKERGLLIPIVISLIIGAAASYGALDYLQSDKVPAEQLVDAKTKISDLEQKVFSLRGELEKAKAAPKADPNVASQITSLKQQIQDLQTELDAAKNRAQSLVSENSKLKSDLQSLSDTANQGNDVSAKRVTQLQQANKQLASDLLSLQDSSTATIKTLNEKIQSLQSIDIANGLAAQKKLADQISQLQAAKADGEKTLQSQVEALKIQLGEAETKSQALQAKLDEVKNSSTASAAGSKALQSKIDQLQSECDTTQADLVSTQKQLADATAKLAEALKPTKVEPTAQPAETPVAQKQVRDESRVTSFLESATGAGNLTPAQKAGLKAQLIQGECVVDSLKTALGRVPVLMLRDLIRDLNSDC